MGGYRTFDGSGWDMEEGIRLEDVADITRCQQLAHDIAVSKGFWDNPRTVPESLALIHSEVSEALEAYRSSDEWLDDVAEELADICIRVLDLSESLGIELKGHILRKMRYNKDRPYKHGKRL